MALFCDSAHVTHVKEQDAFKTVHKVGTKVPFSGIYRCVNCGDEDCCNKGDPFPPQNHHQHPEPEPIGWRLLVFARGKGD
jgi:hypothetical protein